MNISSLSKNRNPIASPGTQPEPPARVRPDNFWTELFSGELNEIGVHLSPDFINIAVDGAQSVGEGLSNAWSGLRDTASKLLDLDPNNHIFPPGSHRVALTAVMGLAKGAGFMASGVQGLGGVYKLCAGAKEGSKTKLIDGVFDLSTSAAVGATIAGMAIGPLVLGPMAAVLGIVRGSYNATVGFLIGDGRREIQGALDATRAASVGLRLSSVYKPLLGTAGAILGPVAGAIQATRGFYDIDAGLATDNKDKQMKGLMDIASAAGLTLAATGVGVVPGIALTALAMGSRFAYQFNDKFASFCDKRLENNQAGLGKAVSIVKNVAQPVIHCCRNIIESVFGTERGKIAKENPRPVLPESNKE